MAWFKVDDKMHSSRKLLAIPRRYRLAALGLWTIAGSWSADQTTDGVVPDYMIEEWGGNETLTNWLVKVGLWEKLPENFAFNSWAEYQPTRAQIEEDRAKNREKLRKWRDRNRVTEESVTELQGGSKPDSNPAPVPSRPDPELSKDSSVDRRSTKRNHPLPADWEPTPEHQERAHEYGLDLGKEAIKFRAHAEEKARLAKNWNAAFTRWLVNAHEYQHKNTPHGDRPYTSDRQGQLLKAEGERIARQYGTLEIDS